MALKINCPHCSTVRRLAQPYPMPGSEVQCEGCGRGLAISYPPGLVDRMRNEGVRFDDPFADPVPAAPPSAPQPTAPPRVQAHATPQPTQTGQDRTQVDRPGPRPTDPTERLHTPLATQPLPPPAVRSLSPAPAPPAQAPRTATAPLPPSQPPKGPKPPKTPKSPKPPKKRSWLRRVVGLGCAGVVFGLIGGGLFTFGVIHHYSQDLPTVELLSRYEPPTVTTVYDRNGALMGEIYEKRRYVRPLDEIPKHVQNAFIGSEDANFWTHDGVDYGGIGRAIGRNLAKGRKAQGASTITQQVARNFLLSSEKTYERKIREILLAWRIEETFEKDHILYLYLNQIYLGSGAYGVEAASRVYFGKSASEISLAEAAILAGLPQRPSDYSPHQHWDKARARQTYVLDQMLDKSLIDQATYDEAMAEVVTIAPRTNEFLSQAPYFTEHIRRYLVDTYGFDKIYNDGLSVQSTCDLGLQKAAEKAVRDNVLKASNSIGWRGPRAQLGPQDIAAHRQATETALRQALSERSLRVADPASGKGGHDPLPSRSTLEVGQTYEGVVIAVQPKHATVAVGDNEILVPVEWSLWMYEPNAERSFKSRAQRDLTQALTVGDVLDVHIEGLKAAEVAETRALPEAASRLAGRIYQEPELQGAFLSYRLEDGGVVAMVGGYDFASSEFNRATQAMRQVGSTIKPIVYASAIATRKVTAGTLMQDAPTVFGVLGFGLYKPDNYGEDYLGNITMRKALALSRNVVTVRILDKVGLEPVFQLAGPGLRIGFDEPKCSRRHVPLDSECSGSLTPSPVAGMGWCEECDPTSCSLVQASEGRQCLSEPEEHHGESWCRSCDLSLRACAWVPRTQLSSNEICLDARIDESSGQVVCRACDLSTGLGSSSLTVLELTRAYSAFATYGQLIEPYWIEKVVDRDGTVIEQHEKPAQWRRAMEPGVAGIAHWMLREVATAGTAASTNKLGIQVAGKTGTTNDFKDTWFVGYNPDLVSTAWVGYDQPRSLGVSFTGGGTALPIWMDYMTVAAPKDQPRSFPPLPNVEMVPIDESTGRAARGGRPIPMLPGTAPTNVVGDIGEKTAEDLLTSDF